MDLDLELVWLMDIFNVGGALFLFAAGFNVYPEFYDFLFFTDFLLPMLMSVPSISISTCLSGLSFSQDTPCQPFITLMNSG